MRRRKYREEYYLKRKKIHYTLYLYLTLFAGTTTTPEINAISNLSRVTLKNGQ